MNAVNLEREHFAGVRRALVSWRREVMALDPEFCRAARLRFIDGALACFRAALAEIYVRDDERRTQGLDYGARKCLLIIGGEEDLLAVIRRLEREREARMRAHVKSEITEADVEAAREFPIERMFPGAKRGRVVCPFHDGAKHLSAGIKDNRFKCFKCGATGDSIEVAQRLYGLRFVDAVKLLAGGGGA